MGDNTIEGFDELARETVSNDNDYQDDVRGRFFVNDYSTFLIRLDDHDGFDGFPKDMECEIYSTKVRERGNLRNG